MVNIVSSSLIYGILLIVLGVLGIVFPYVLGGVLTVILGWLLLIVAVVRIAQMFLTRKLGGEIRPILRLLLGVSYAIVGLFILTHPTIALAGLTLWIGILFLVEGVSELALAFVAEVPNKAWIVLDGAISCLLGLAILRRWPLTGLWVVGTLVGINFIFTGLSAVSLGLALRSAER